ncbi:MAG: peptidase [Verrucomicrobia bacterium]|nr:peptidase [Verrucomicrobiota bacterium]
MNRIVGLETEYGCLTTDPAGSPPVVARTRNWIFENHRLGLADVHQRDWDEPAGNGGFLFNGGRAYVDMGHMEYCTPECQSLRDLIAFDRAGDRMLHHAIQGLGLSSLAGFIRNNVDHYSGATFGCHENYLVRRGAPLNDRTIYALLGFLTLRVLYTGAGRVGGMSHGDVSLRTEAPGASEIPTPVFQISQRADYINNDLFEWVQFNRAIINTRDEPLADPSRFRRLHLIHGDSNVLPFALFLKAGTTSLVLDLLEIDQIPTLSLADAVASFREISVRPHGPWNVRTEETGETPALDLLRKYWEAAHRFFARRDRETDDVLEAWGQTLDALQRNPEELVGRVDWITKQWLLRQFVEHEGVPWNDPVLRSLDLEYHHLDPKRGLGLASETPDPRWTPQETEIEQALNHPPANTRASIRSRVMDSLRRADRSYCVDWEVIDADGLPSLHMINPFDSDSSAAQRWLQSWTVSPAPARPARPGPEPLV